LLGGQTTLGYLAAAFMWRTHHAVFLTIERFKKEGFVRLGNANQARSFLPIGQRKKTMVSAAFQSSALKIV